MISLPLYRLFVDESVDGVQKISLVHSPAVESNFLAFNEEDKDRKAFKFEADEEQHIVFGCALRADYPIYRRQGDFEYYVIFDKQSINTIVEQFAKNGNFNNVNVNHEDDVDGVYLTQMFIKDTEKGINPEGFEDIEEGSLFTAFKVENEDVWEKVKSGEFQGFSVEGCFKLAEVEVEQSVAAEKQEPEEDEIIKIINEILN